MDKPTVGALVRHHNSIGFKDLGRVVLVMQKEQAFWYVPFPPERSNKKGAASTDIPAPCRVEFSTLTVANSFPAFVPPKVWSLTDDEIDKGIVKSDLVSRRTDLKAWGLIKKEKLEWLAPLVESLGPYELLECGRLRDEVNHRCEELGLSSRRLKNALYAHLFGCGNPNVHLPGRWRSGGPGRRKLSKEKTGRPRDLVKLKRSVEEGFINTEISRAQLLAGYRKYKKPGVSDRDAYLLTCHEYWPGDQAELTSDQKKLMLAPKHQRPTERMFTREAAIANLHAQRIHMGERVHENCVRARRGTAKDGVLAVGQLALIDSTSEDQTPVSEISPLLTLPSTWRCVVFDVRTEYILGVHSGFESPSTLTNLLAVVNGASDKTEFCARYGVTIKKGEWHSRFPKRIRGDNGELKSQTGIKSLNRVEASIEFVRSYGARFKGDLEATHRSMHAHADHKNAGSTRGRARQRGEPSRESEACRTHRVNMRFVIEAILRHNNEEPVQDLLTVEMRRAGVQPTRRAIFEWLIEEGYEASEPQNIDEIRTLCLPRLRASVRQDGLFVFDPRYPNERLIKGLCYTSKWLQASGMCERAARQGVLDDLEILLDPNDLAKCYLVREGGLQQLDWLTRDPLALKLSLCEYLLMVDEDKVAVESLSEKLEDNDTRRLVENRQANSEAKKAKKKAQQAHAVNGGSAAPGKRANREQELKQAALERLGLGGAANAVLPSPGVAQRPGLDDGLQRTGPFAEQAAEQTISLMDQFRAKRSTNQGT